MRSFVPAPPKSFVWLTQELTGSCPWFVRWRKWKCSVTVGFGGFVICKPEQHRLPGLCRSMDGLSRFLSCPTIVDPCVQRAGRAICTRTRCSLQLLRNYHKEWCWPFQGFFALCRFCFNLEIIGKTLDTVNSKSLLQS